MEVILAEELGMCFGVKAALEVIARIERPEEVTVHGELVHNEVVLSRLAAAGFSQERETARSSAPPTPAVLVTAHGISESRRSRILAAGKRVVDTTCPLVTRVHEAAMELERDGRHVILVGRPGHVEVQGIVEDLATCDIVDSPAAVRSYGRDRLGVICQTTAGEAMVRDVLERVRALNPVADIRFADTVCEPTRRRQLAVAALLEKVDVLVVVGGSRSNNTRELAEAARARGVTAYHVQGASDLDPGWFRGRRAVGLTAGTSTLDETIEEVRQALLEIAASASG